jgi:hypothetical protein
MIPKIWKNHPFMFQSPPTTGAKTGGLPQRRRDLSTSQRDWKSHGLPSGEKNHLYSYIAI